MATLVASVTALVIASLNICSVVIICFILLVLFYFLHLSAFTTFLLLTPCYNILPYYDDNAVYMSLSVHSKLVMIIAKAYIHSKHHLLLACDWLQRV